LDIVDPSMLRRYEFQFLFLLESSMRCEQ
jgi:hypothetical protein